MRVAFTKCLSYDPDVPLEAAFVTYHGELVGVTGGLIRSKAVVMCDDGKLREVALDEVRKEAHDAL